MKTTDEMALERGLKIREYPGKWSQAKNLALNYRKDKYEEDTAFALAYRLFLELGGESGKPIDGLLDSEFISGCDGDDLQNELAG